MDSSQDREKFEEYLKNKITVKTRQNISSALLEIFTSHDIIIASSLGMDVYAIVCDAAISEVENFKEQGGESL